MLYKKKRLNKMGIDEYFPSIAYLSTKSQQSFNGNTVEAFLQKSGTRTQEKSIEGIKILKEKSKPIFICR
jgi:hypothetical protein